MGFETNFLGYIITTLIHLNFFPMGFETLNYQQTNEWSNPHLNFFPMGFETRNDAKNDNFFTTFELLPYGIWNAEHTESDLESYAFELLPYGIWNKLTASFFAFGRTIWTSSLWDLKQIYPPWI